jgi:hypothetical protein
MTDAVLSSHTRIAMTPRKRLTAEDARLRSLRVRTTRLAFVGGAIVCVLALVGSVIFRAVQVAALPQTDLVEGENLVIDTPRFVGRAKDGGKIVVTAQKATRSMSQDNGAVQLVKPVLETADGSKATADVGVWSQESQNLSLNGNVVLNRQDGDVATAAAAEWTSVPAVLRMREGVVLRRQNGDQTTSDTAVWLSDTAQLAVEGNVTISRPSGDQATGNSAVWADDTGQLSILGNVNLARQSGERASGARAVWRTDTGALELSDAVAITLPSGESATAQFARFDQRSGDLLLSGGTTVRFAAGQASSSSLIYRSNTGQLFGQGGIAISSNLGNGRADRYVYETRSKRLNLSGNARATLRR